LRRTGPTGPNLQARAPSAHIADTIRVDSPIARSHRSNDDSRERIATISLAIEFLCPTRLRREPYEELGTGRSFVPPGAGPPAHVRRLLGDEAMPNWGTAIESRARIGTEGAAMGTNHDGILRRLGRIEGQVTGIGKMQADRRYCIDVLDQISAARAGLEATPLLILEDHVNGCVREAIEEGKGEEKARELLEAVGRFARSV